MCGPVHSDCPKSSRMGMSREAKYSSTSTEMGAAEVMHILVWCSPRFAFTLDRISACAQPKPTGAPPLCVCGKWEGLLV